MKFKAVVFDLDGTLIDSLHDIANSMNAVLQRLGFPAHPAASYRYYVGEGVELLARRALPEAAGKDDACVARCVAAMREEYGRRWAEQTRPYPGIAELLDALAARELPLSVLSNKPHDLTQALCQKLLPTARFAAVLGSRPGVPRKPDPAAALEIVKRLGIPAGEFFYLGDTRTDMVTAVAAGMYPAGALWGFRTAEELLTSGARVLLEKPGNVLGLL